MKHTFFQTVPSGAGSSVVLPSGVSPSNVLAIIDSTSGAILFKIGITSLIISYSGQTITLNASAPVMTAGDELWIVYDDGASANPSTIYSYQQIATTSAVALPSQALVNGITLTALGTNTQSIYVGPSGVTTSTGFPLSPGQSSSYAVTNLNAIYMIGQNTADVLAFTGN